MLATQAVVIDSETSAFFPPVFPCFTSTTCICVSHAVRVMTCYLGDSDSDTDKLGVLDEAVMSSLCDVSKWHHVALTFTEKIQGTRSIVKVPMAVYCLVIKPCYS